MYFLTSFYPKLTCMKFHGFDCTFITLILYKQRPDRGRNQWKIFSKVVSVIEKAVVNALTAFLKLLEITRY